MAASLKFTGLFPHTLLPSYCLHNPKILFYNNLFFRLSVNNSDASYEDESQIPKTIKQDINYIKSVLPLQETESPKNIFLSNPGKTKIIDI